MLFCVVAATQFGRLSLFLCRPAQSLIRWAQADKHQTIVVITDPTSFYISWQFPWSLILDSSGSLIARSKLVSGWAFIQRSEVLIEFEGESLMKWKLDNLLSLILQKDQVIRQSGVEIIRFKKLEHLSADYYTLFKSQTIAFKWISNTNCYDIFIDNVRSGHIKQDSKFNVPFDYKHVGTEIKAPSKLVRPCIIFAIISNDYFGTLT